MRTKAKKENLKISTRFASKIKPLRTFGDPGTPKKVSLGPDQAYRGPPLRPLARLTHVLGTPLGPPEPPLDPTSTITTNFCKSLKHIFLYGFGHYGENHNCSKPPFYGFGRSPGAIWEQNPLSQNPVGPSPPKVNFRAPEATQDPFRTAQERPRTTSN